MKTYVGRIFWLPFVFVLCLYLVAYFLQDKPPVQDKRVSYRVLQRATYPIRSLVDLETIDKIGLHTKDQTVILVGNSIIKGDTPELNGIVDQELSNQFNAFNAGSNGGYLDESLMLSRYFTAHLRANQQNRVYFVIVYNLSAFYAIGNYEHFDLLAYQLCQDPNLHDIPYSCDIQALSNTSVKGYKDKRLRLLGEQTKIFMLSGFSRIVNHSAIRDWLIKGIFPCRSVFAPVLEQPAAAAGGFGAPWEGSIDSGVQALKENVIYLDKPKHWETLADEFSKYIAYHQEWLNRRGIDFRILTILTPTAPEVLAHLSKSELDEYERLRSEFLRLLKNRTNKVDFRLMPILSNGFYKDTDHLSLHGQIYLANFIRTAIQEE